VGSAHRSLIAAHLPPTVQVTAYCDYGTTRFGATTRLGIAATDIRVITHGTTFRILIPTALRKQFAGYLATRYQAEDTGGAVIGRIVDIWMPSCAQAIAWGRHTLALLPGTPPAIHNTSRHRRGHRAAPHRGHRPPTPDDRLPYRREEDP
jgi:3D (Asp-Asp-Asp) domain-containing protein